MYAVCCAQSCFCKVLHKMIRPLATCLFLNSFLLHSWRAMQSYRPHLEERNPIWGSDWSHSPFIRRYPSWGFLGYSSAVRQIPGDLCTALRTISLSPLSLATDVTDATFGASGLGLGNRTGAAGTATLAWSFFGRNLWLHERHPIYRNNCHINTTRNLHDYIYSKKNYFVLVWSEPLC